MGYEIKIYLGESQKDFLEKDGHFYMNVAAMVDLRKPGYDSHIFKIKPEKVRGHFPVYIYDLDGNTQYTKDCYGLPLIAIPVSVVLNAIRKDAKMDDDYRPFHLAIPLLREFKKRFKDRGYAVLYGH